MTIELNGKVLYVSDRSLRYVSKIIACTCFGIKYGENNVGSHILFEISLTCVTHNVSGRAMLPHWTVYEPRHEKTGFLHI